MTPRRQETFNSACTYVVGSTGLGAATCIDFTQWWHIGMAVLSTLLLVLQASSDIPKHWRRLQHRLRRGKHPDAG